MMRFNEFAAHCVQSNLRQANDWAGERVGKADWRSGSQSLRPDPKVEPVPNNAVEPTAPMAALWLAGVVHGAAAHRRRSAASVSTHFDITSPAGGARDVRRRERMRLHDFLDYQARERGDAEFATQGNRRFTYREALAATHQLANAFVSTGLQIGDRIAVLSKNSIEFVLLYFAASKAGVVPVPLNYRLAPDEWRYIVNDAGARMLLVEEGFLEAVDTIRPALPTVERFVALGDAGAAGWEAYHPWVTVQPITPPARLIMDDQALYQLYTSGTTGHPKGAVLTHRAVTTHLMQFGCACPIQPGERLLLVVPLFHASGANAVAFQSVYWGRAPG